MTREQQYWEDTQEALSRIFDRCEEIDPQSGYEMLEDIQFIRGFINKCKPRTEKQNPKMGWIPVSERLPEPYMFVNATCRSLVDDRENWVVETVYLPIPKEANKHGYSDWGNIPMLNWGEAEVIAWMERIIPKPYVVEEQTGENI